MLLWTNNDRVRNNLKYAYQAWQKDIKIYNKLCHSQEQVVNPDFFNLDNVLLVKKSQFEKFFDKAKGVSFGISAISFGCTLVELFTEFSFAESLNSFINFVKGPLALGS